MHVTTTATTLEAISCHIPAVSSPSLLSQGYRYLWCMSSIQVTVPQYRVLGSPASESWDMPHLQAWQQVWHGHWVQVWPDMYMGPPQEAHHWRDWWAWRPDLIIFSPSPYSSFLFILYYIYIYIYSFHWVCMSVRIRRTCWCPNNVQWSMGKKHLPSLWDNAGS